MGAADAEQRELASARPVASLGGDVEAGAPTSADGSTNANAGGGTAPALWISSIAFGASSRFRRRSTNRKDFPEHLVDGKAETAWNSKTGDLNGFIAFRAPAATRVKRIELTAGFDKVSPTAGDLFTKNHRITNVRLTREGKLVKEGDDRSECPHT